MGLAYRFTLVDALRGVAALSVVLFHAIEGHHIPALFGAMPAWLQTVLEHGNCGVAIFFVLSGFVIAHSLRPEGLTAVDVGRFMLKRSVRLDPPYWGAIAIAISFSILASAMLKDRTADHFTIGQIAAHIFYLQELLKIREINPVFWTLCMEVQFYIVFAALLLTKSRVVLFMAFAISLIWPLGLSVAPTGLFVSLWYGFLVGAGSYLSWKNSNARPWFYLYAAILTSAMIYRSDVFGLTCCATALLLHSASRLGHIGTSLNWRWIQFLGMISYSLYLIHGPITGAAFRVGFTLTGHSIVLEAIWWAVSLAASIAAAAIFYFIMERPSIKLSKMITIHQQKNKASIPEPHNGMELNNVQPKLAHLEAMRGIAALVVVANHFALTFSRQDIWFSAPWFVLINGGAAVTFFFVLSGYVLTLAPLYTSDSLLVVRGAIKRWPRLWGPVLIAVLFSCLLWQTGSFWHVEAADITGSKWLATFAGGVPTSGPGPDMSPGAAIAQGTWRTFIFGEDYFDSSLWTMKIELFGSMIAFALAAALIAIRWRSLQIAILTIAAALVCYRNPVYLAFWLGVLLAWSRTVSKFNLPKAFAIPMLVISLYLLGYSPNILGYHAQIDFYGWLPVHDAAYVHGLASATLLMSVAFCPPIRKHLDGVIGRTLGRYSFPVYLVHILLIMSIGMAIFVLLFPVLGEIGAAIASIIASIAGTIVVASALAYFEARWIRIVNQSADFILFSFSKVSQ